MKVSIDHCKSFQYYRRQEIGKPIIRAVIVRAFTKASLCIGNEEVEVNLKQRKVVMKIQPSKLKASLLISFFMLPNIALSSMPVFSIVLVDRPLTVNSLPIQKAQANSNFNFNLSNYISKTKIEVDYRVTNNAPLMTDIGLLDLPAGITRVYEGEGVCGARFSLNTNQSCILRFIVNKAKYTHSLQGAPIVCYRPPNTAYCSTPQLGQQINDVVSKLPGPTKVKITPVPSDGLQFNPDTLTISGKPNNAAEYNFSISATNGVQTAAPRPLQIKVNIDPKDKPVFKTNYSIGTAMPEQEYRINLMDLIEPKKSYMVTNQVTFKIVENQSYLNWLSIDPENTTFLKGKVSSQDAGQTRKITLIATSNSGGESLPLTLEIPIAYDPSKKPIIAKSIMLTATAGETIHNDFRPNIIDPASDSNLKLVIEKIKPDASWLKISAINPTALNGKVPDSAVGQNYLITLAASTPTGGTSDKKTIPLMIAINKDKTPRFYQANPNLPLLYEGQSYSYDFVANNDVEPEFNDVPYSVTLAKGYPNPDWVSIKNNKLIVDKVPEHLEQMEKIFITIKNIPGGISKVFILKLFIMN